MPNSVIPGTDPLCKGLLTATRGAQLTATTRVSRILHSGCAIGAKPCAGRIARERHAKFSEWARR
jgi:hypothetical protein